MRILIVTQYFWPESFRINDLALGLEERGYKVTVLTGKPNYPSGSFFPGYSFFKRNKEEYEGIKILRVPLVSRGNGGKLRLMLNYVSFVLSAMLLAPFRCRDSYDIIFVYEPSPITVGLPALLLKAIKGTPIMFWVQDLWPESLSATNAIRSQRVIKIIEQLVRFIYRGCDRILIQSKAFFESIVKLGAERDRILYFPNSAEELYRPVVVEEDAPELMKMPQGFRVMFAGNIGTAQDFPTIIAAAELLKEYKDIHWIILGNGRMYSWVNEMVKARKLTDTVHLLGWHPVESMPRYFSIADAMLVTLKREVIFSLTIPSKLQSYLACSKPVIAALEGEGARVITEAGAGLTVPPEDPKALSQAVLDMYRMSYEELMTMGASGRQYYEKHFERAMLLDRLVECMQALRKEPYPCEP
ncbi:MAG: glycosyltransferase family 4 protein [Nitrospirota bacterium]